MDALWKIGECLLRWGTLAYCSVFPAVSRSYDSKTYPCPVEQKYHENGPYQVTVHLMDDIHVFVPDTVHNAPLPGSSLLFYFGFSSFIDDRLKKKNSHTAVSP